MPKGIGYSDEFRRDAVSQFIDRGYSVQEVADSLGITTKSLYGWKAQFGREGRK